MDIVFMGTPDFAVPCLKKLVENKYNVKCVVTQPDKPKGRGQKLTPPPVKEYAQEHSIEVLQPQKVKKNDEFLNRIVELAPDVIIVVAYGKILPASILRIPKQGCINVHASLLPKYRGAAPIQWSVINGEKTTGVTTMFMDEGMDTGDMILKMETPILENEDVGTVHDRLSDIGAEALIKTLEMLSEGALPREKQDESLATYAPMIEKTMGEINWKKSSEEIKNLVRGLNPWPGTYTFIKSERIRIYSVQKIDKSGCVPGKVESVTRDGVLVGTGNGSILIKEVQPENGRRMTTDEYVRGHSVKPGQLLGM